MPSIGYGDKTWPNLEALCYDANSAKRHREEAADLRWLVGAIASKGPIRVSKIALDARLSFSVQFDPQTSEYILTRG